MINIYTSCHVTGEKKNEYTCSRSRDFVDEEKKKPILGSIICFVSLAEF